MSRRFRRASKDNSDIQLLLSLLLVFGFVVDYLHGLSSNNSTTYISMSINSMISYLHPLILSGSVEKIADFAKQLSPDRAHMLAKSIITEWRGHLSRDDLLELIFALATQYAGKEKQQNAFFNLISEYQSLFEDGPPLAYVAAASMYASIIPVLEDWAQGRASTKKDEAYSIKGRAYDAALYAIDANQVDVLKKIFDYARTIRAQEYTDLLWHAVEHNKDARIIPLLVRYGADPKSSRGSYTVLMQGVKNNNLSVVKELIKIGADINTIIDNETGSALQLALVNNFVSMEQLLRSHGALE